VTRERGTVKSIFGRKSKRVGADERGQLMHLPVTSHLLLPIPLLFITSKHDNYQCFLETVDLEHPLYG
jgi:hypothetical protein